MSIDLQKMKNTKISHNSKVKVNAQFLNIKTSDQRAQCQTDKK